MIALVLGAALGSVARGASSSAPPWALHGPYSPKIDAASFVTKVEPQLEKKWYAAGTGEIQEQVIQGAHERFQLVAVTH